MEVLGIGPLELLFILIIALLVLGPEEMRKASLTFGRWMSDFKTSDWGKAFRDLGRGIKQWPTIMMREANLVKHQQELEISLADNEQKENSLGTWVGEETESGSEK